MGTAMVGVFGVALAFARSGFPGPFDGSGAGYGMGMREGATGALKRPWRGG